MTRFYFHFRTDQEVSEDEDGLELPDATTAYATAVTSLRDVLADEVRRGVLTPSATIEIVDENHQSVGLVTFNDVLAVKGVLQK